MVSPQNPLKPVAGMAPFAERLAGAQEFSRHPAIRVIDIEQRLGTRYTVHTLSALRFCFPRMHFVWIMGADNLAQFGQWKDWRGIARLMPIAVIARPGYDDAARGSAAMSWLRRFVRPARQSADWTNWRVPALVLLRFRPDPRSATLLRQADPLWHREYEATRVRDPLTRRYVV